MSIEEKEKGNGDVSRNRIRKGGLRLEIPSPLFYRAAWRANNAQFHDLSVLLLKLLDACLNRCQSALRPSSAFDLEFLSPLLVIGDEELFDLTDECFAEFID
jgi:hypothetical protein